MSMHLEFEPHSWYKGAAIKKKRLCLNRKVWTAWDAYYLNGMTGYIVHLHDTTLAGLKQQITDYINAINERDRENRRRLGENV